MCPLDGGDAEKKKKYITPSVNGGFVVHVWKMEQISKVNLSKTR